LQVFFSTLLKNPKLLRYATQVIFDGLSAPRAGLKNQRKYTKYKWETVFLVQSLHDQGMSQYRIAKMLGISTHLVWRWVHGIGLDAPWR